MNSYKKQSFLKLTWRFGVIFLIVITILKMVIVLFKTGSVTEVVGQYFGKETWLPFVKIQLVISAIYGLFMAGYYKFIKKE